MNYWFIIHNLEAFEQHPDLIGCAVKQSGTQTPTHGRFSEIKRGDKIVYYATGDKVIVGTFEVISDLEYLQNDPNWGETMVFRIKPDVMPPAGKYLDFKALIYDPQINFDLFPEKERWMYQLWGHVIRQLPENDFKIIESQILTLKFEPAKLIQSKTPTKIGEALGRGLLYTPVDEMGVVFLFSKFHKELGFPHIVKIQSAFPDVLALDKHGQPRYIELEYYSSSYKQHLGREEKCDIIICWEHDWSDIPEDLSKKVQIIPLKEALEDILGR